LEGETIGAGRLIMLTSRHAVLYVDGSTVVVPAAAVKRIESRRQYMIDRWMGK
jgi:hypothetical protein